MQQIVANSRVWLEINLQKLIRNYKQIATLVAPCNVICVLKANAYGLGIEPVADALHEAGCRRFGVAELSEAIQLATKGYEVQILGAVLPCEIEKALAYDIILPVGDMQSARLISKSAFDSGCLAKAHILIDTGMGRLGISFAESLPFIREVHRFPNIHWEGIYSHFPVAYRSGSDYTNRQMDDFESLLSCLNDEGITFSWRHIANSDGINNFPRAFNAPYNAVRTGINLHGAFDSEGRRVLDLEPVITLKTRLAAVRRLAAGTSIGYGRTFRLRRDTVVGTISAGYADGLPLALSNKGSVLVHDIPCKVLGRVSMDYTTIDLDCVPSAKNGDEVTCLGGKGSNAIPIEQWAQFKGTHPYDIICSFGTRVERRYLS